MVHYLLYRGCTGKLWCWSFDTGVVTVGQGPVLGIWGCTFRAGSSICDTGEVPVKQGQVLVI